MMIMMMMMMMIIIIIIIKSTYRGAEVERRCQERREAEKLVHGQAHHHQVQQEQHQRDVVVRCAEACRGWGRR
jgi:competence protein ComGC